MPNPSELARVEEEQMTPIDNAETILAALQARARGMNFGSVNEALDHLADVLRGEL